MIIDIDNWRVLYFRGAKRVTHADVANSRDCFTVWMRISVEHGKIERPLVIFQNPSSKYPIAGIPDNIDVVSYESSSKGWVSSQTFSDFFSNQDVITPLSSGRIKKN